MTTSDRTAAALHGKLVAALDALDDAERRYADLTAWGRAQHPELSPAVADMRTATYKLMRDAMQDWTLAHQRVQSYAAALTAVSTYAMAQRDRDRQSSRGPFAHPRTRGFDASHYFGDTCPRGHFDHELAPAMAGGPS